MASWSLVLVFLSSSVVVSVATAAATTADLSIPGTRYVPYGEGLYAYRVRTVRRRRRRPPPPEAAVRRRRSAGRPACVRARRASRCRGGLRWGACFGRRPWPSGVPASGEREIDRQGITQNGLLLLNIPYNALSVHHTVYLSID